MARPKKETADFFPHNATMRDDPKIKAVRRKYGVVGYGVWCMLLEYLCGVRVFRVENTDLALELLAGDFGLDIEEVRGLLDYFVRVGLIQKDKTGFSCTNLTEKYLKPLFDKRAYDNERKLSAKSRKQTNPPNTPQSPHHAALEANIFHSGKPAGKESKGKERKGQHRKETPLSRSRSKEDANENGSQIPALFDYEATKAAALNVGVSPDYFEELWHHYKGMGWKDGKNSLIEDLASKIIARWIKASKEEQQMQSLLRRPEPDTALHSYQWALDENLKQPGAMKLMQGYMVDGKVMYRYAPPDGSRLAEYVMIFPVDERKG
jgi:hypothetical protein